MAVLRGRGDGCCADRGLRGQAAGSSRCGPRLGTVSGEVVVTGHGGLSALAARPPICRTRAGNPEPATPSQRAVRPAAITTRGSPPPTHHPGEGSPAGRRGLSEKRHKTESKLRRPRRNCADRGDSARPDRPVQSAPGRAVAARPCRQRRPLCANGAARYSRSLTRQRQLFARVASHGRHSRGAGAGERPPLRLPHRRRLAPVALHDRWDRARRMVQPVQRRPGHQRPCSVGLASVACRSSPASAPTRCTTNRGQQAVARGPCATVPARTRRAGRVLHVASLRPGLPRTSRLSTAPGRLSTPTLNQVCPQPRSEDAQLAPPARPRSLARAPVAWPAR